MAKQKLTKDQAQAVAKALEVLFTTDYISRKELYKQNFIRGMFFSAGTIIGATIIVVFSVWGLSFFDEVPILGPAFNRLNQAIEQSH